MNRSIAIIDQNAFMHNWQIIKNINPNSKIILVVKANAYGHGFAQIVSLVKKVTIHALAIACIEEAIELRKCGYEGEIYLFDGGAWVPQADLLIKHNVVPIIGNLNDFVCLANYKNPVKIHLKIDTGFIRNGFSNEEISSLIEQIKKNPQIIIEGLCTHFHSADDLESSATQDQISYFLHILAMLKQEGINPDYIHAANSAAFLRKGIFTNTAFLSRIGLLAYGYNPITSLKNQYDLKPIMSIKAKIISHKKISKNQGVGYNHRFIAKNPTDIAVVSIGYADGIKRALSNKGFALFNGVRVPIVGNVCMDFLMLDITNAMPKEKINIVGQYVTLLGSDGQEIIDADHMAAWADTISHEILTSFSQRINRSLNSVN